MKTIKVPHTLVLLFYMMIAAYILTWLLPAGSFQMTTDASGHQSVIPGSYQQIADAQNLPIWDLFTVIPRALGEAQGIIFFLFLIGGSIAVLRKSGAIDAMLGKMLKHFSHRPALLLFMSMFAFMVGSSTIGMAEEYIPLVLILISLCHTLKMDTVSAVGAMVIGYGIGYGVAPINPFTVLVAQDVAQLQPTSGWEFRLMIFVPFMLIGFHHLWQYASQVISNPQHSYVHQVAEAQPPKITSFPEINPSKMAILLLSLVLLVLIVYGIAVYHWYFVELGAIFFVYALLVGLISGYKLDDIAITFSKGAAELTGTALLIGFARSIEMLLSDGQVLHTVIYGLSNTLSYVGAELSAIGMFIIQSILNLFIPSGSGQAYVTMPIMAPIADVVGITRQTSVLAYQMGDGFMNMIVPTNAVLMGILGVCGIPYDRWFKFIAPLVLKLMVAGSITLVIAVSIGYN
ncbi:MAG: TIGR00366 family protein [Gammaproteobacteria bacterium]|nr:TIGR00366 family protein [Gammaproteobacteria bacterium]MDH5630091.1 TIGR00366 family protein [Gammaproteobacteria bacterium]